MMRGSHVGGIVILFLLSFFLSAGSVVADWHGGKALVLYSERSYWPPSDGWVQHNYRNGTVWEKFRNEFAAQGWTVDFAKHVAKSLLSNYDALFVLTPVEDIPNDEAQAIIDWVKSGGQLVITQNGTGTYANNITAEFGIEFDGPLLLPIQTINSFTSHPVTTTPNSLSEVDGITARKIEVSGSSKEIGWYDGGLLGKYCLLAVNDTAGEGVVVAIGDEWMWSDCCFDSTDNDNEELLDNILVYFRRTCSVPEFSTPTFLIPVFLLAVLFLFRRKG